MMMSQQARNAIDRPDAVYAKWRDERLDQSRLLVTEGHPLSRIDCATPMTESNIKELKS